MDEGQDGVTGQWETIGSIILGIGSARTFGFGNMDELGEDFDLDTYAAPKPASDPQPLRLDPYKATSTDSPADLSESLVLSSTLQENPESEEEPLRELPLEVTKDTDGKIVGARLAYLTALVYDLELRGEIPNPTPAIDESNGAWLEAGTLALLTGRCFALNPRIKGRRIVFEVKPGYYKAEVYEFTDAELGYYDCDFGLRIRWSHPNPQEVAS